MKDEGRAGNPKDEAKGTEQRKTGGQLQTTKSLNRLEDGQKHA